MSRRKAGGNRRSRRSRSNRRRRRAAEVSIQGPVLGGGTSAMSFARSRLGRDEQVEQEGENEEQEMKGN